MIKLIVKNKRHNMSEATMEFGPFYSDHDVNTRIKEMKEQLIFSNPKKNFIVEDNAGVFLVKNKSGRILEEYKFKKEFMG